MDINSNVQFGFHYYDDVSHFTKPDFNDWLYRIGGKAPAWLVLKSSCSTAIPEFILRFCEEKGIQPLVSFDYLSWLNHSEEDFQMLLEYYKKNGVHYIQLGGYMNMKGIWSSTQPRSNLLQQIASVVISFHKIAAKNGFLHVLPKLIQGGDYWDLTVLKSIFQQFKLENCSTDNLVLSFLGHINDHLVSWGNGGANKWGEGKPYQEVHIGEDHQGLMGFQWYQEIAVEILGREFPVMLLETIGDVVDNPEKFGEILPQLWDATTKGGLFSNVVGVCLSYQKKTYTSAIYGFFAENIPDTEPVKSTASQKLPVNEKVTKEKSSVKCISHYLLLPQYAWGISPVHLEAALPFIRKYKPTIGYSVSEAKNAKLVTIVMDDDVFSAETVTSLKDEGCKVVVIRGDGTEIAAKLSMM